jgi:hypothetical protein
MTTDERLCRFERDLARLRRFIVVLLLLCAALILGAASGQQAESIIVSRITVVDETGKSVAVIDGNTPESIIAVNGAEHASGIEIGLQDGKPIIAVRGSLGYVGSDDKASTILRISSRALEIGQPTTIREDRKHSTWVIPSIRLSIPEPLKSIRHTQPRIDMWGRESAPDEMSFSEYTGKYGGLGNLRIGAHMFGGNIAIGNSTNDSLASLSGGSLVSGLLEEVGKGSARLPHAGSLTLSKIGDKRRTHLAPGTLFLDGTEGKIGVFVGMGTNDSGLIRVFAPNDDEVCIGKACR